MKVYQRLIRGGFATVLIAGSYACGDVPTEDVQVRDIDHSQSEPVINGVAAGSQARAIQGAMLYQSGSSYRTFCGSVYLGTNAQGEPWAATAAHCVDALGSVDRFGFGGSDVGQYNASNTVGWVDEVRHPSWNTSGLSNDMAVVRLAAVPANATAVTLASASTDASAGEGVTISGYGYATSPSLWCLYFGFGCPAAPAELLEADTFVLSTSACRQTFSDVDGSQICVEDATGAQGACNGDSGGPMFRNNGTVVGVTSFGVGGCDPNNPQVYTRISAFRQWIADTTGI